LKIFFKINIFLWGWLCVLETTDDEKSFIRFNAYIPFRIIYVWN